MHRAVAVLALLVLACGNIDIDIGLGGDNPLADTEWRLTSLGPAGDPAPVVSGSEVTADFEQDDMSGWTGCNSYNGARVSDGSSINTEELLWTERGCPSDELRVQEELFLELLVAADSFVLSGDQLVISTGEGSSVLIFARSGE